MDWLAIMVLVIGSLIGWLQPAGAGADWGGRTGDARWFWEVP